MIDSLPVRLVDALRMSRRHVRWIRSTCSRVLVPCRVYHLLAARYDEQPLRAPSRSVRMHAAFRRAHTQSLLVAVKATREYRTPRYTPLRETTTRSKRETRPARLAPWPLSLVATSRLCRVRLNRGCRPTYTGLPRFFVCLCGEFSCRTSVVR